MCCLCMYNVCAACLYVYMYNIIMHLSLGSSSNGVPVMFTRH